MPASEPPEVDWEGRWQKMNRRDVEPHLKKHFRDNFVNTNRRKQVKRRKTRFAAAFLNDVEARGGDGAAAEAVLRDLTQRCENRPRRIASSLCVQWPHCTNMTQGHKKYELRRKKLGPKFKGVATEVYVNESNNESDIKAHEDFRPPPSESRPGALRGTITLTGRWLELNAAGCTDKLARECAVDGKKELLKALKRGYKYAWELDTEKAWQYRNPTPAQKHRAQDVPGKRKAMAQVWTTMQRPPALRALRAL
jgi:predicted transcriptional regulator